MAFTGRTLLLVGEREPDSTIERVLRESGLDFQSCKSCREAIETTRRIHPDIVVFSPPHIRDLSADFCGQLRAACSLEPLLFLLCKQEPENESADIEIENLVDGLLPWPFSAKVLHSNIALNLRLRETEAALRTTEEELSRTRDSVQQYAAEADALLQISGEILGARDFEETAQKIFHLCAKLIGASAGYVALLNSDGTENEVLFPETGGRLCDVESGLPMSIRGLRATAYEKKEVVYKNRFAESNWTDFPPEGPVVLDNVLFAPLSIDSEAGGLLGFANKPGGFDERDCQLAKAFGELAAVALKQRRFQEELQSSSENYRLLAENTLDCIWTMDLDMRFTYVNPAVTALFGYSPEEFVGTLLSDHCSPEEMERCGEYASKEIHHTSKRQGLIFETNLRHRDGFEVPVEIHGNVIIDSKGEPIGLQGVTRDISERKESTRFLRDSLNRLTFHFQQTMVGWIEWDFDFRVREWNPAAERLFGYSRDEALGQYGPTLIVPQEVQPHVDSIWHQLLEQRGGTESLNLNLTKDGSKIYCQWFNSAIPGATNDSSAVLSIVVDVTARKHAEDALRENEERLRSVFSALPAGVVLLDAEDGEIIEVNSTALQCRGLTHEDTIGRHYQDFFTSNQHQPLEDTGVNAQFGPFLDHLVGGGGDIIHIERSRVASEIAGRRCLIETFIDITKRIEAQNDKVKVEKQLEQAKRMEMIGQLAGGIAHDFNNVLQTILTRTYFLVSDDSLSDSCRADVVGIQASTERASSLVKQLLAFSRQQVLVYTDVDLNKVVRETIRLLGRLLPENVDVQFDADPASCCVHIDKTQIERVLINLCINARDAMPDGGATTIETKCIEVRKENSPDYDDIDTGKYVRLSVADTGSGMDAETKTHIFEPFFTTKGVGEGTGLGLATIYGIVHQHDGKIFVESEEGRGTVFRIYLSRQDEATLEQETEENSETPTGSETILLAEDDRIVRQMASRVLDLAGYRVLPAENGEEAVELFKKNHRDISMALLDCVMPRMDGVSAYAEMQALSPDIKVLFCSGYDRAKAQDSLSPENRESLLEKPFTPVELLRRVRAVLDS